MHGKNVKNSSVIWDFVFKVSKASVEFSLKTVTFLFVVLQSSASSVVRYTITVTWSDHVSVWNVGATMVPCSANRLIQSAFARYSPARRLNNSPWPANAANNVTVRVSYYNFKISFSFTFLLLVVIFFKRKFSLLAIA